MIKKIYRKLFKKPLVYLAKRYGFLRRLRHYYKLVRNTSMSYLYQFYKVDDKQIIFEVFMGRSYSDSPKAIYELLLQDSRFDDFSFVWAFKKPGKHPQIEQMPRTSVVRQRTLRYYKTVAQSKFVITNSMLPSLIRKKDSQKFLQTWHGTPLKRLRLDLFDSYQAALNDYQDIVRKNNVDVARYDGFVSPSHYTTEKFTSGFGLTKLGKENIIIEQGYPRNDFLFQYTKKDVSRVREEFGIPKDKKVILYTPTWRDNQHDGEKTYTFKNEMDFDYLREQLSDEYVIIYRPHYFVAAQFDFEKYEGFVYRATPLIDSNDLYIISDVLITDYSSAFFDYAILKKPMIFFAYDIDEYKENLRGFYFDMETLPGDITKSEKDITKIINNLDKYNKKHAKAYKDLNKRYNHLDDGGATKRTVEAFFFDGPKRS